MKNDIRLHSIYFPFFAFILCNYLGFLPMLPINFAVTALVIFGVLFFSKAPDIRTTLKRSVVPSFLFGLLADLTGVFFRFLPLLTELLLRALGAVKAAEYLCKYWSDVVLFNIYSNNTARGLVWTACSIAFAGIFVFIFNYFFALRKAVPDKKLRRRLAIFLGIFTAPYSFMNPYW